MAKRTIFVPLVLALLVIAMLTGVALYVERSKASPAQNSSDRIVATVGGTEITLRQVEGAVSVPLYLLDMQRQQLLLQAIQTQIDEELLKAEASRQGQTVPELIAHASESETIARLANYPAPVKRANGTLDSHEQARVRQALIVSLRRKADIHITLPTPTLPIVPVSVDDDPRLGPDDAPVTIIEFSDFQCPFCQKSVPVLQELRRIYGDKLRLVYRDFPGHNHASALPAAEASQCAREQGKFWEYHDLLFNRQAPGEPWDFVALAAELQLDAKAFSECFNSAQFRAEVDKDLQDGLRAGVTSTPTFFINGRPLVGFHPISEFQELIDQALQDQNDQSSS
jgi:protein-disulfide isomerase